MATHDHKTKGNLGIKEKVVVYLFIIVLQVLAPWEYGHQFKEVLADLKELLKDNPEKDGK